MKLDVCQECISLIRERDELRKRLAEAESYLREGKARFAPHTTNSNVDVFLERCALRDTKESNVNISGPQAPLHGPVGCELSTGEKP